MNSEIAQKVLEKISFILKFSLLIIDFDVKSYLSVF